VDQRTGLREYCAGAASNEHASGREIDPNHPNLRFIRPEKGGFLSVCVDEQNGQVVAEVTFHDVDGTACWEDRLPVNP
jgi:hypothetical protein